MTSSLKGKTIVFTGTLDMKRTEATTMATNAGAKVTAAVSGNTDILVAGAGAGSKMATAKAKGVDVWTEEEFKNACSSKTKDSAKKPPTSAKKTTRAKSSIVTAPGQWEWDNEGEWTAFAPSDSKLLEDKWQTSTFKFKFTAELSFNVKHKTPYTFNLSTRPPTQKNNESGTVKNLRRLVGAKEDYMIPVDEESGDEDQPAPPEKAAGKKRSTKEEQIVEEQEGEEDEEPPKKVAKKVSTKYCMPTLKLSTKTGKPLEGMTIVFSGSFGKCKKADMEVRATKLGAAKVAGSVSGKTSLLVLGANSGDKEYSAVQEGAFIWTLAQFETLEKTGKGPTADPVPAWGVPIASSTKLPQHIKDRYLMYFQWMVGSETNRTSLFFPAQLNFKDKADVKYRTLGALGADAVSEIIASQNKLRWILMNSEQNLKVPEDLDALFGAVVRHDTAAPDSPISCMNLACNRFGDGGIEAVCKWLPRTKLDKIYFYACGLNSPDTARELVKAVKATPTMTCVEIDSENKEALQVLCEHNDSWGAAKSGGDQAGCRFVVDNITLTSSNMDKLEKKQGFPSQKFPSPWAFPHTMIFAGFGKS